MSVLDEQLTDLGAAVRELLDDPRFADAARRVAAEIAALPPVGDAADLIASVA